MFVIADACKTVLEQGDWARTLFERHGGNTSFGHVDCWVVYETGDPDAVVISQLWGLEGGDGVPEYAIAPNGMEYASKGIFPRNTTYAPPQWVEVSDGHTTRKEWIARQVKPQKGPHKVKVLGQVKICKAIEKKGSRSEAKAKKPEKKK